MAKKKMNEMKLNLTFLRGLIFVFRFVDGEAYFDAVADALESAEEEILITGWW